MFDACYKGCTWTCLVLLPPVCLVLSAGEDPVGPQNWFKEAHGQPAEGLPREDVGPHLPPGGKPLPIVWYPSLALYDVYTAQSPLNLQ